MPATWTAPKTWAFNELVDETDLNTHVRDNLLYLKDNPVLNEVKIAAGTASQLIAGGSTTAILVSAAVAIPAGVGAVYVECQGHVWFQNAVAGSHQNSSLRISEASAGDLSSVGGGVAWRSGSGGHPFSFRTSDLAYGGTTRTFTLTAQSNFIDMYIRTGEGIPGLSFNGTSFPLSMRVVRSY